MEAGVKPSTIKPSEYQALELTYGKFIETKKPRLFQVNGWTTLKMSTSMALLHHEKEKTKMSNVVYQLTVEDVSHFLTNKEHLNEVVRRIQKDFSCMEEMKYFIQRVEEQLYMESETSQTKVTVSHNHLNVYKRRPETVKKEQSFYD